jgi:hypothetical protein
MTVHADDQSLVTRDEEQRDGVGICLLCDEPLDLSSAAPLTFWAEVAGAAHQDCADQQRSVRVRRRP